MFNSMIIGNLGADAELKSANGSEFITFRVAHNDRWKDANGNEHNDSVWVDCVINGNHPVLPYLKRGTTVCVIGNTSLRVFSSKIDKCMKAGARVNVRSIELISGSPDAIPSKLVDASGVIHDVTKFFHVPVANTTLMGIRGGEYLVDANGWVSPSQPQSTNEPNHNSNDEPDRSGDDAPAFN